MRRWLVSLRRRRRLPWGLVLGPAGLTVAVFAERALFHWDDPRHWIPDLLVGLTYIGCGIYALRRERGTGVLLAATGCGWFLGNFDASALHLYRGSLVHVIVTFRGWRPWTRLEFGAVVAGWVAALAAPLWRSETTAIVFALALVGVVGRGVIGAEGRERRDRLVAFRVAVALGLTLASGAVVRLMVPSGDAIDPILLVYQAVLCGVALVLAAGVRAPTTAAVTDLVVELGETQSGTLRDALAATLGDPTLEVGYWAPSGGFVDVNGQSVPIPSPGDARSATFVER